MCNHEEVLDSGEYICIKSGIVLDQEYLNGEILLIKSIQLKI